jgi:hypothetical protein
MLFKPRLLDSESLWHTMEGGTEEPDELIAHVRVFGGLVG